MDRKGFETGGHLMGPGRLSGRRVLVADDNMELGAMLSAFVHSRGGDVIVAEDGIAALAELDGEPRCDVVITDLDMGRMNGDVLIAELRRRPRTRNLPVLVLTGSAPADHHLDPIRDVPGVEIMVKPVRLAVLEQKLADLIEGGAG
jgi:CheY-like chemotaxis protein